MIKKVEASLAHIPLRKQMRKQVVACVVFVAVCAFFVPVVAQAQQWSYEVNATALDKCVHDDDYDDHSSSHADVILNANGQAGQGVLALAYRVEKTVDSLFDHYVMARLYGHDSQPLTDNFRVDSCTSAIYESVCVVAVDRTVSLTGNDTFAIVSICSSLNVNTLTLQWIDLSGNLLGAPVTVRSTNADINGDLETTALVKNGRRTGGLAILYTTDSLKAQQVDNSAVQADQQFIVLNIMRPDRTWLPLVVVEDMCTDDFETTCFPRRVGSLYNSGNIVVITSDNRFDDPSLARQLYLIDAEDGTVLKSNVKLPVPHADLSHRGSTSVCSLPNGRVHVYSLTANFSASPTEYFLYVQIFTEDLDFIDVVRLPNYVPENKWFDDVGCKLSPTEDTIMVHIRQNTNETWIASVFDTNLNQLSPWTTVSTMYPFNAHYDIDATTVPLAFHYLNDTSGTFVWNQDAAMNGATVDQDVFISSMGIKKL